MRLVWTEQALTRLIEIQDFVSADDPEAAVALHLGSQDGRLRKARGVRCARS